MYDLLSEKNCLGSQQPAFRLLHLELQWQPKQQGSKPIKSHLSKQEYVNTGESQ